MKRTEIQFLADIYGEILGIEKIIQNIDYETFVADSVKLKAVKYSLIVIGEASNKLSAATIEKYNRVNWKDIISLRNRIIHEYFGLKVRLLWDIVSQELEKLKSLVVLILESEYPEDAEAVFKYYEQQ
jgi:uncharacterized protein with HEPN domain